MLKGYIQAYYSPENWQILLDIKTAADTDIDNAISVADVMTALNTAEASMAAVHTLLDDAKAAAHASLDAALAGYSQADYTPENWTILLNAMTAGNTDNADSVEDVTMALKNAEAAMAAIHTILTDGKIAAHTGLETVLAVYSDTDYSPDDWAALNGFKTAGDTAIDEAADLAGVEAAQSAAVAGMAGVQTIAQTLASAKSAAHDALQAALETYSGNDYTTDDWTALNGFKIAGDTAIDEVADLAGVEAAQLAATAGMTGVQTITQILAAAKSAAHDALQAALGTYSESDYIDNDWTVLNGYKTAGDALIDDAANLAGVEVAQSAAVAGMDSVQTFAQTLVAAKSAAHDALAAALGLRVSNDTVEDGAVFSEFEAIGDTADDSVSVVDQTEYSATVDLSIFAVGTEEVAAGTNTAYDSLKDSHEVPATSCSAPDVAEEKTADLESSLESTTSDIE